MYYRFIEKDIQTYTGDLNAFIKIPNNKTETDKINDLIHIIGCSHNDEGDVDCFFKSFLDNENEPQIYIKKLKYTEEEVQEMLLKNITPFSIDNESYFIGEISEDVIAYSKELEREQEAVVNVNSLRVNQKIKNMKLINRI